LKGRIWGKTECAFASMTGPTNSELLPIRERSNDSKKGGGGKRGEPGYFHGKKGSNVSNLRAFLEPKRQI